jgi:hypothetical protein
VLWLHPRFLNFKYFWWHWATAPPAPLFWLQGFFFVFFGGGVFMRFMGSGPKQMVQVSPGASTQGDTDSDGPKSVNFLIGQEYPKYSTKQDILKI